MTVKKLLAFSLLTVAYILCARPRAHSQTIHYALSTNITQPGQLNIAIDFTPISGPTNNPTPPTNTPPPSITNLPPVIVGNEFYVSPTGSSSGDGSQLKPWNLAYALSSAPLPAGHTNTVWLRNGVYPGTYICTRSGSASGPTIYRQYPGERATINSGVGSNIPDALSVRSSYVWFWGFEVTTSRTNCSSKQSGSYASDLCYGYGINLGDKGTSQGVKFINLTVDNTAQGIGEWKLAQDTETSGCLFYYNGWVAPDRGHGHGIYVQNEAPSKQDEYDNIAFSNFGHGEQAYGFSGPVNNINSVGFIGWNNGELGGSFQRNLLIGGVVAATNPIIQAHYSFYPGAGGPCANLGYYDSGGGSFNGVVRDSYIAGRFSLQSPFTGLQMSGNHIDQPEGFTPTQFPQNTFGAGTGLNVFVRPNKYERGRCNVAVFNYVNAASAQADISGSGIVQGEQYDVLFAGNPLASPVASGTYNGNPISLPLVGLQMATLIGSNPIPPTNPAPTFAAFIVKRKGT